MRQELRAKQSREVRSMFARIAPRYDLLNRLLSLGRDSGWRRIVARRAAASEPAVVVDVCSGTGDLALELDPPVVGADFCLPMLTAARTKAIRRRRQLPLCVADALELPFASASVDVVTVAFGIRNFESLDQGLAELARVLRPGGRLLVLEFSRPRGVLGPVLSWWVRTVPPRVGRWLSGDSEAYTYLPTTIDSFPDGDRLCRQLRTAGLTDVTATPLTGGVATLYEGVRTEAGDGGV